MKKFIVLLITLTMTVACSSVSTPQSRSLSIQTVLPTLTAEVYATLTAVPTATLPPEPTASWTPASTATTAPADLPTPTPVLALSFSPTSVDPTQTESAFTSVTGSIAIVGIIFDGSGDKEPDEYVEIRNDSDRPLQLESWTLRDKADHIFFFPDFVIQPGQVCRIYTDQVHPDSCGFSFGFDGSAIWNNGGDCAYLKDHTGTMITEYCY